MVQEPPTALSFIDGFLKSDKLLTLLKDSFFKIDLSKKEPQDI
jgi:hypothetical protein